MSLVENLFSRVFFWLSAQCSTERFVVVSLVCMFFSRRISTFGRQFCVLSSSRFLLIVVYWLGLLSLTKFSLTEFRMNSLRINFVSLFCQFRLSSLTCPRAKQKKVTTDRTNGQQDRKKDEWHSPSIDFSKWKHEETHRMNLCLNNSGDARMLYFFVLHSLCSHIVKRTSNSPRRQPKQQSNNIDGDKKCVRDIFVDEEMCEGDDETEARKKISLFKTRNERKMSLLNMESLSVSTNPNCG